MVKQFAIDPVSEEGNVRLVDLSPDVGCIVGLIGPGSNIVTYELRERSENVVFKSMKVSDVFKTQCRCLGCKIEKTLVTQSKCVL